MCSSDLLAEYSLDLDLEGADSAKFCHVFGTIPVPDLPIHVALGGHLHVVSVDLWTSQWLNEHRDLEDVVFFKARLGTAYRM